MSARQVRSMDLMSEDPVDGRQMAIPGNSSGSESIRAILKFIIMPNIQVTHDANINNARSESAIVVNPNNPLQIVTASKRFNNIHTYDFTLATSFSTDGGNTWADSATFVLPPGATVMTDPTLAWDDIGNVYSVGLVGNNPPTWTTIGIAIYKSTDGGQTWSAPNLIHQSIGDDKQWVAGDSNPASPFHGRVYTAWDDGSAMRFARTKDHGATWESILGNTIIGTSLTGDSFSPEINVSSSGDVYIVWIAGSTIKMLLSTDGGDSFQLTTAPATGVTTLSASLPAPHGWPNFPGGTFRVLSVPTACVVGHSVYVAWDDFREGVSRIYFALSADKGATWLSGTNGQPLLLGPLPSNMQHFFPQIIADPFGVIGCSFYEFGPKPTTFKIDVLMAQSYDNGGSFDFFTVTDQPWDPVVDAPWSHGDSNVTFIGDYFGIDASRNGFFPLWTDTRTGIQELFTTIVPEKKVVIVIERSTLGQDEIDTRRNNGQLPIQNAFRVIVDGFTAGQLGLTSSSSNLAGLPTVTPGTGITVQANGNVADNGGYGPEVQRFTFSYSLGFPNDSAFGFATPTKNIILNVNVLGIVADGLIELIKQPNPFILHGDPYWLSIDLRVFVVRLNEMKFGVPGVTGASDAPRFISALMSSISDPEFQSLSTLEDQSKLYTQPNDENHVPVFNFALARIHYIGSISAPNVRVFFRLFQAQTTSAAFNPATSYRRWPSNLDGQPIALPGIQGNEYVTIPCFANGRVIANSQPLTQQTDPNNIKTFPAGGGAEAVKFFGCWLDINQPATAVLPVTVPGGSPNGPFTDPSNPPLSVQQSILRNLHQCLIAEIAFDPVTIPLGKDPSNWDKLAQRNIDWSDVGSAEAVSTFEIKPTEAGLPLGVTPDELMIDWGNTPKGSIASIYLPAVPSDTILSMASRMYMKNHFTREDDHTVQCKTSGITYLPIPPGTNLNYAGLLSVAMPDHLRKGDRFTIAVRQITNAVAKGNLGKSFVSIEGRNNQASKYANQFNWRLVSGAFQITIPVKEKATLRLREERDLSVLLWIFKTIPAGSRWYPVFDRYLKKIAGRVKVFGGDPTLILPSPTGDGPWDQHPHPGHPHGGVEKEGHLSFTGKIAGLLFDHFGDFEGFVLEGLERRHEFFSRENAVKIVAERAWSQRLRLTVRAEPHEAHRPLLIIVHEPPTTF